MQWSVFCKALPLLVLTNANRVYYLLYCSPKQFAFTKGYTGKMKILLTGANGYIGKRLLPDLLEQGHTVHCCVRDPKRFHSPFLQHPGVRIEQVDLLKPESLKRLPKDMDAAYYLVHSMSSSISSFSDLEATSAQNFTNYLNTTAAKQLIYLSGLLPQKAELSPHLASRLNVEKILQQGRAMVTTLRAGIIVGSGSASFEIIRDLTEKLPLMITPKWVNSLCQPLSIHDVIQYLQKVLGSSECIGQTYDIGGPDILSYKQMLLGYAQVRGLKRIIWDIPVMTPRLSSYWLYFITNTSYKLAVNLVDSMKMDVICRDTRLEQQVNVVPMTYKEAISRAFRRIEQQMIKSSWKDALITSSASSNLASHIQVPEHGCFYDKQLVPLNQSRAQVIDNIWSVGGQRGWYYANTLWRMRGFLDKLWGGVGLRRGRTHPLEINTGDALDFWRVLLANKSEGRLLLFAEMKLPGEAWLEFKIVTDKSHSYLSQQATFRPKGLLGRLYWAVLWPLHYFIFRNMAKNMAAYC